MPRKSENANILVHRAPRTGRIASVTNKFHRRTSIRRVHVSGMPVLNKDACTMVKQAKQRQNVQVRKQVRWACTPPTPPATEMYSTIAVSTPKSQPCPASIWLPPTPPRDSPTPTRVFNLPSRLARPTTQEVSQEAIAAIDHRLADTPVGYIRDHIQKSGFGRALMTVCNSIEVPTTVGESLPSTVEVTVKDGSAEPPTHMLAVWSNASVNEASSSKQRVTLYPIHALVSTAHLAHLPPLPQSVTATTVPRGAEGQIVFPYKVTLPVVPLCVPDLDTFSLLSAFTYARDPDGVLRALVPAMPRGPHADIPVKGDARIRSAALLAKAHSPTTLMKHAGRVNALWRNACALGAFDPRLWAAMDAAWTIIIGALRMQNAMPCPTYA